jgi:nitroreductase
MSHTIETPLSALDAIFTRRSVRAYQPKKLDEPTVRSLLDAAVQAPTAVHMEPWAFVVIQDDAILKRISDAAKASWMNEAKKYEALHVPHAGRGFAARVADPGFSLFYEAGTLIVICAKPLGPFVEADCWLAAENLMLAACALGLGSCCVGSVVPVLRSAEVKSELSIPADITPVAPIIVGVPAGTPADAARRNPDVLSWKK